MSESTTATVTRDHLLGGEIPAIPEVMTIISGQNLSRGAVIGKITTGGKGTVMVAGASDGSEDFYAVLAEDCDASAGDKVGTVYKTGMFITNELTFGAATTIADVDKDAARGMGCFFKTANF